jgi:hypothetical protein
MLHPAILRASKQVYSEAMPILYKKNKFRAEILYSERSHWSRPSALAPICALIIHRPGGKNYYLHRMETSPAAIPRCLFENPSTLHMLRMLTHLTIDLVLVTPRRKQGSDDYSVMACNVMKGLCSSLTGDSKLKELSIVIKPGDQDSSDVDPADVLWPLLLLREDITVKFECLTTDRAKKSTTEAERTTEIGAAFCSQIALVKRLCISELGRSGWEGRCWALHGMREAEKVLYTLYSPGKETLCLDDIVNKSPVWKDVRGEIDRAEASGSEQ